MPGSRPPAPEFPLDWWRDRRESAARCLARYPDWKVGPDVIAQCDWHIRRLSES